MTDQSKSNKTKRYPITYKQSMEIFERFFTTERGPQAAPTIANEMLIDYRIVCETLAGKHWPAARAFWMDRVLP